MTEAQLQELVAAFLRAALPDDAVFTHVMNEGKRGWKGQRAIKRGGVRKGWPDLQIIYRGRFIAIELKSKAGRVSPAQKQCHQDITLAGGVVTVCRSVEDVGEFLAGVMPLKAKL